MPDASYSVLHESYVQTRCLQLVIGNSNCYSSDVIRAGQALEQNGEILNSNRYSLWRRQTGKSCRPHKEYLLPLRVLPFCSKAFPPKWCHCYGNNLYCQLQTSGLDNWQNILWQCIPLHHSNPCSAKTCSRPWWVVWCAQPKRARLMVGSTSHHNHSLDRTVELFTNLKSNNCVLCGQHSISKRHSELND